ncbi:hypothetical protein RND81_02G200800 [Saponaria officinalis]|uniref:Uncharacterized protein n=1 Tax=Saponaria officinalis TaxID=3572 RepID=A0AAW1MVA5_SAPOF
MVYLSIVEVFFTSSDHLKNEDMVSTIVDCGAVPALVMQLQSPPEDDCDMKVLEHEVEKGCAFALGLLAFKVFFVTISV